MKYHRIIVDMFDDVDYKLGFEIPAEVTDVLSFNGRTVEVDLSEVHHKELETVLAPYLAAGRKPEQPKPYSTMGAARKELKRMRAWAVMQPKYDHLTSRETWAKGYIPIEIREGWAQHNAAS